MVGDSGTSVGPDVRSPITDASICGFPGNECTTAVSWSGFPFHRLKNNSFKRQNTDISLSLQKASNTFRLFHFS